MTYELLYIIPSQFSDTDMDDIIKRVSGLVEKVGGNVVQTTNLGKIKLAYPIKKTTHGTYVLSYFELEETENLSKLETELKHTNEVLRHTLIRRKEGIPTYAPQLTSYRPPLTPEGKRAEKPEPPKPKKPKKKKKISVEELDKKLDEIMDSKDLSKNV